MSSDFESLRTKLYRDDIGSRYEFTPDVVNSLELTMRCHIVPIVVIGIVRIRTKLYRDDIGSRYEFTPDVVNSLELTRFIIQISTLHKIQI